MNNKKHELSREQLGDALWEALQRDSSTHRTDNYDSTFTGDSTVLTVREGRRFLVTQHSRNDNDITVEQYESKKH